MIRFSRRLVITAALLLMLFPQGAEAGEWRPVRGTILFGISGMALVEQQEHSVRNSARITFIVVHDNKNNGEGRVALVSIQGAEAPKYTALQWRGNNSPVDLEALTAVPGQRNSFMALTSAGSVYHIRLNAARTAVEVVKPFKLPNVRAGSNFEGFTLQKIGSALLAVWAHRGANQQPGVLYWSLLSLKTYRFSSVRSVPLKAPWPPVGANRTTEVRHVSDLKIDASGTLFISSASDPGNDGPFQSALYLAGTFHFSSGQANLMRSPTPLVLNRSSYLKIEAFDLVPGKDGGMVLATDDENMGSSIYPDW